ncbi:unnamed protein product, partial [marine sediment metagenome]
MNATISQHLFNHHIDDKFKLNLKKKLIKKMTEIKKLTKISLVVIGIVTFMFGILLIFL